MALYLRMEIQEVEEQQPEVQGVAIYSKWAVLLFSIFFTPIAGSILLMLNLRSVGLKREGNSVLLFAIAYQLVSSIFVSYFFRDLATHATNKEMFMNKKLIVCTIIGAIIGGGILAEYFFKKYFPYDDYERKSVWKPLIITILIVIPINLFVGI